MDLESAWTRSHMLRLIALLLIVMTLTATCILALNPGSPFSNCVEMGLDTVRIICTVNGTPVSMTVTPS